MNRTFSLLGLVVAFVVFAMTWRANAETAPPRETITLSDIESGAAKFDGQILEAPSDYEKTPKEKLFQQYGTRTFTTFKKHPELVTALRKLNPDFDPEK